MYCNKHSSVGTATLCGLDGPGKESRLELYFPQPSKNGPGGPLSLLCVSGYFPGVEWTSREVNPSLPFSDEGKN